MKKQILTIMSVMIALILILNVIALDLSSSSVSTISKDISKEKPSIDSMISSHKIEFTRPSISKMSLMSLSSSIVDCGLIDSSGIYTLNNDLMSNDSCIVIDSDDVVLNGNGKKIIFNIISGSDHFGISIINGHNNITIKNFKEIKDSAGSGDIDPIYVDTSLANSAIINNTLNSSSSGYYGAIWFNTASIDNINISNNNFYEKNNPSISFGSATNIFMAFNNVYNSGGFINAQGDVFDNNIIINNYVTSDNQAVYMGYNNNNIFKDNYFNGAYSAVSDLLSNNNTYINNTFNCSVFSSALEIYDTYDSKFINNSFYSGSNAGCINFEDASYRNLYENNFCNDSSYSSNGGFYFPYSEMDNLTNNIIYSKDRPINMGSNLYDNIIENHLFQKEPTLSCLVIGFISNNNIINNTLLCNGDGIDTDTMIYSNIIGNKITSFGESIAIGGNSGINYIEDNNLNSIAEDCIYFGSPSSYTYFETLKNNSLNCYNNDLNVINSDTRFIILDHQNITKYYIRYKGNFSFINDNGRLDLLMINGSGNNLFKDSSSEIILKNNFVSVDSIFKPYLNGSAQIEFDNINVSNVSILRNGILCDSSICSFLTNLTDTSWSFFVTGFTNYSLNGTFYNITPSPSPSPSPTNSSSPSPSSNFTIDKTFFILNFNEPINLILIILLFIVMIILCFIKQFVPAGFLTVIFGFILLFSNINILISFIFIALGIVIIFVMKKK